MPSEKSLYDLVKDEAAARRLPPIDVWQKALLAIEQGNLKPQFAIEIPPIHGTNWLTAIYGARQAAERGNLPDYLWTRSVLLDSDDFNRWLDSAFEQPGQRLPRLPRRRASDVATRQEVQRFLEAERRANRAPSTRRLWDWMKRNLPEARREQAEEAMEEIEGGPKGRGRPRKA